MHQELSINIDKIYALQAGDSNAYSIEVFEQLVSTNDTAKQRAQSGAPHALVIVADKQTGGRGRQGKSFFSPQGCGVYMSVVLRPTFPVQMAVKITSAAAVAVSRAVERVADCKAQIKWVNDILVDGKKVCGILTEAVCDSGTTIPCVVIGIGINALTPESAFPQDIKESAGSLLPYLKNGVGREHLIAAVLDELRDIEDMVERGEFIAEYKSRSAIIGKEIKIISGTRESYAKAVDIDDSGALIVESPKYGRKALNSGEISIRLHRKSF